MFFFLFNEIDYSGLNSGVPSVPPQGGSGEAWVPGHLSSGDPDGVKAFLSSQFLSAAGKSSDQPNSAREDRLDRLERILDEHTKRNTAAELRARQAYLEQREKHRQVRVSKFTQKPHQYHAGDLFDIEPLILDLAEHARHLIPSLAPLVGQPILNATDFELQVDNSKVYSEGQLAPLISMI